MSNNKVNENIVDIEFKAIMKQQLEKNLEEQLSKRFDKNFRISISADADILTDSELDKKEKIEILKFISAYLLEFDLQTNSTK